MTSQPRPRCKKRDGGSTSYLSYTFIWLESFSVGGVARVGPRVIVIVNSKLLKRHSKAKRRAPAYSRALRQIRGVFQRIVRGRLRSVFQRVRECVKSEVFSKE